MKMKFFLDMDGPCCRFIHGALKALDLKHLIDDYPADANNLHGITKIPYPDMYKIIDSLGSEYWRNLEETPSFWELYDGLCELGQVTFCTSPSLDPSSSKGKVEWLQDRFGKHTRNYILTQQKYHCASPYSVLIDDTKLMCEEFTAAGGNVVQYPTRLNGLSHVCHENDRAKYVLAKVKQLKEDIYGLA